MTRWCGFCQDYREGVHPHGDAVVPSLFDMVEQEHERLMTPDDNRIGKAQQRGQSITSKDAALAAMPRTGTQRHRVLIALCRRSSLDEELQDSLGMNPSTERPRRVELVEGGWVQDSGLRRQTRSGQSAVVWELTPRGRAQLGSAVMAE